MLFALPDEVQALLFAYMDDRSLSRTCSCSQSTQAWCKGQWLCRILGQLLPDERTGAEQAAFQAGVCPQLLLARALCTHHSLDRSAAAPDMQITALEASFVGRSLGGNRAVRTKVPYPPGNARWFPGSAAHRSTMPLTVLRHTRADGSSQPAYEREADSLRTGGSLSVPMTVLRGVRRVLTSGVQHVLRLGAERRGSAASGEGGAAGGGGGREGQATMAAIDTTMPAVEGKGMAAIDTARGGGGRGSAAVPPPPRARAQERRRWKLLLSKVVYYEVSIGRRRRGRGGAGVARAAAPAAPHVAGFPAFEGAAAAGPAGPTGGAPGGQQPLPPRGVPRRGSGGSGGAQCGAGGGGGGGGSGGGGGGGGGAGRTMKSLQRSDSPRQKIQGSVQRMHDHRRGRLLRLAQRPQVEATVLQ